MIDFKNCSLKKAIEFAQSLKNEDDRISVSIEDWDTIVNISITTTIGRLHIIFYSDGKFRNFMYDK